MVVQLTPDLTNVKLNEQSLILKQLSAGTVCGSLRGTEPLRRLLPTFGFKSRVLSATADRV